MRIISGRFRHRTLHTNPGLTTRPITDRAKVILFDRLEAHAGLKGRRVADIFAGTGTMGLEALSRGASSVVFIEQDHRAHELLLQNVAMLHAEDETLCWRVDVFRTSFKPKGEQAWFPYDLIFFDPPYDLASGLKPGSPLFKSLERLTRDDTSSLDALLVLRTPKRAEFHIPEGWRLEDDLRIASMGIHVYRKGFAPQMRNADDAVDIV